MTRSDKTRAARERFVRWFLACESARREHGEYDPIPEFHMESAIEEADRKESFRAMGRLEDRRAAEGGSHGQV